MDKIRGYLIGLVVVSFATGAIAICEPAIVGQPNHIPRQNAGVQSSAHAAEAEFMHAIEAVTYVDKIPATTAQTFNAWNLHVCTQQASDSCDFRHASDIARLYGHPTVYGIPFDELTFCMCNREFVRCNQVCQAQYEKAMLHWPPLDADWKTLTSSGPTLCIGNCNSEAIINHQYIANSTNKPPNLERDANLVFCYSRNCQGEFQKEMAEFQRKNNE
ncbi:hypothetical protein HBH98_186030 [Parastagonospora nodorum]|nr:hypothetical protein HBH51_160230 [Parastagonospora nodorum]KAH4176602.1 hypothetical protein HBH43_061090 [Parastagonospora nodorum]KAH4205177.1 hypothetical protein HBI95_144780 [Parastagonospora nodorum]KAH4341004.1 hypothetical protein HBH98_186030 [Parastagonospora nodorum]KAH4393568.1 hypothetical protein HBH97_030380 [Parastagonospora nodorum]